MRPGTAFDGAVLGRLARRDAMPVDPGLARPRQHRVGRQLGAVVADDHARLAVRLNKAGKFPRHPQARDRRVHDRRQALARDVVHDVQHAKTPAAHEPAMHEVQRPAFVRPRDCRQRCASADRTPSRLALAHGQPLLRVEPLRLLAVDPHAFAQQQDVQPPIAKAPTLPGQLAQPSAQRGIVAAPRPMPDAGPIRTNDAARPPLAHPKASPGDARPLRAWRRAPPLFSEQALQPCVVEHGLRQQPLQLGILLLEPAEPTGLGHLQPATLRLPGVRRRARHPVLATQVQHNRTRIGLLQDADDLLVREPLLLHPSAPSWAGL